MGWSVWEKYVKEIQRRVSFLFLLWGLVVFSLHILKRVVPEGFLDLAKYSSLVVIYFISKRVLPVIAVFKGKIKRTQDVLSPLIRVSCIKSIFFKKRKKKNSIKF